MEVAGIRKISIDDILNSTDNSILAIDRQGNIVYCNRRVEQFLELPAEKILGRHVLDFFPDTGILSVLKDGSPQLGRRLNLKNGTYISNRNPVLIDGEVAGAVAVFHDITYLQALINELHSENERIKELQETLQTIMELSTDGVVAVNKDYIITMANQSYASLLDKKPADLIGRNIFDCYKNPQFVKAMESGLPEYGYVMNLNGHEIVANRVPIKKNGEIVGALGVVAFKNVNDLFTMTEKVERLRNVLAFYRDELDRVYKDKFNFDKIVGETEEIRALKETARRVARTNSTVLLRGESGTGKELFAHALHSESLRSRGPFVKVNCAAIPEPLLESELFGYVEGAFTGAKKGGQIGKFELAHFGTIFLDEIGDMAPQMQAKLLRVLQEKTIERLGEGKPRKVDVRVIAATNRDLEELMREKLFREDLYYRLNVVVLPIPPLRERKGDIPSLTNRFIEHFNKQFGLQVKGISSDLTELFMRYHWPGNIRELQNVIERAFNVIDGDLITKKHLPLYLQEQVADRAREAVAHGLPHVIEKIEKEAIIQALAATRGNRNKAAALLNISRAGFYNKMKKYNIKNIYN
ncbi:MAG: sigma 54-interacting transcriptional regulator [Peptococcaceae bacterium]|nr:sigma 54-interacting transcriptional regulator [Peptococcaceae bacterium]